MNFVIKSLTKIYSALLHLYPVRFRDEFAEEMQVVFEDSVNESVRDGILPMVLLCLRELSGLPFNILREFWHEFKRKERTIMANVQLHSQTNPASGSWKDMFLAGIPHLAVAIFSGTGIFFENIAWYSFVNMLLGILLLAGLFAAAVIAWRQKWPLWSASWYGYWVWVGLITFVLVMNWLNNMLGIFVDWQFNNVLSMIVLALPVIGLFWLFRKNRIKGILSVFFLMPVLLPMLGLEFVPDDIEGLLAFASGLIAALGAALIVRWGDWRTGIWLALGGNLLMGIAYSYVKVYKLELSYPSQHIVNLSDLFINLIIFITVSAILIFGPFLFWSLWDFGKRLRKI